MAACLPFHSPIILQRARTQCLVFFMSHTHARNNCRNLLLSFLSFEVKSYEITIVFLFPTLNTCFALACVHHLLHRRCCCERRVCVSAEQQTDNKLVYRTAESNYRTRNYKHMKNGRLSDPTKYGFPFSLRASLILLHYATIYGERRRRRAPFCYLLSAPSSACMSECQGDDAIN